MQRKIKTLIHLIHLINREPAVLSPQLWAAVSGE